MSKLANLDFPALKSNGENYLDWALDARIMLRSKGFGDTIISDNKSSDKDRYSAIYIIHHHLQESLKIQYKTMENPLDLWNALQRRYDHQKTVMLPRAQYDWKHLRFQDYKTVDEYNSILFKIVSMMELCGEKITELEMLNKTFSTMHSSNANNELLMKNSEMRPLGTAPLPDISKLAIEQKKESNLVHHNNQPGSFRGRSRGRGGTFNAHRRGRGRGNTPGFSRGRGCGRSVSFKPQIKTDMCHRCGMGNHWAKNCRTPKHLCELYIKSLKEKPEAHMVRDSGYEGDDDEEDTKYVQNKEEGSIQDTEMEFQTSDILK
ncbi:uncharacterized protein LOC108858638 [Raphanus sativus]|uniref:Uncharacterized protein LOC108858638 n=1 Tax=Raphanus sativus TaxID=3726 RepID=A0A6J0NWB1_RAPSA|nr:uncharacterized protein LOC108858638 [Raphanus sativus]